MSYEPSEAADRDELPLAELLQPCLAPGLAENTAWALSDAGPNEVCRP
jgi:hypothetical protein